MTEYSARVTFCDDVRQEVGGKISVMGIYRGFLGAGQPGPLPKVVALVLFDYPKRAIGAQAVIRVMDRDSILAEARMQLMDSPPLPEVVTKAGVKTDIVQATIPIEMIGVVPEDGVRLRVEIECPDFSYVSDELAVVRAYQQ